MCAFASPSTLREAAACLLLPLLQVVLATSGSLDRILRRSGPLMLNVNASWCRYCRDLEPEYSRAASTLKGLGIRRKLVSIDGDEHKYVVANCAL